VQPAVADEKVRAEQKWPLLKKLDRWYGEIKAGDHMGWEGDEFVELQADLLAAIDLIMFIMSTARVQPAPSGEAVAWRCPSPVAQGRLDRFGRVSRPPRCTPGECSMVYAAPPPAAQPGEAMAALERIERALRYASNAIMATVELARSAIGNTNAACLVLRSNEAIAAVTDVERVRAALMKGRDDDHD